MAVDRRVQGLIIKASPRLLAHLPGKFYYFRSKELSLAAPTSVFVYLFIFERAGNCIAHSYVFMSTC